MDSFMAPPLAGVGPPGVVGTGVPLVDIMGVTVKAHGFLMWSVTRSLCRSVSFLGFLGLGAL